jgi:hypothetical protein
MDILIVVTIIGFSVIAFLLTQIGNQLERLGGILGTANADTAETLKTVEFDVPNELAIESIDKIATMFQEEFSRKGEFLSFRDAILVALKDLGRELTRALERR